MPIETKDGIILSDSDSYKKSVYGPVSGIHFVLSDGTSLLALYPFLSHVQMKRDAEIAFHYSFGIVRIKGQRLETIFASIQEHTLEVVKCRHSEGAKSSEAFVREITLEDEMDDVNF